MEIPFVSAHQCTSGASFPSLRMGNRRRVAALFAERGPFMSQTKTFRAGDKVSWKSSGGTAHGKVVKKLTSPTEIKGHHVAASKDNPEYLVETEDGKQAAHKPGALTKG
jgi:hypothetical protein